VQHVCFTALLIRSAIAYFWEQFLPVNDFAQILKMAPWENKKAMPNTLCKTDVGFTVLLSYSRTLFQISLYGSFK
jgi:hypothetical protein